MAINVEPGYYDVDRHIANTRVEQLTLPLTPILLLPYQPNRLRAIVQNIGANAIWVGPDATVTIANGYKVGSGGSLTINTPTVLYGVSQTAAQLICILIDELLGRP